MTKAVSGHLRRLKGRGRAIDARFPRSFRLLHSLEFARVMREGRRIYTENLVLFVAPGEGGHSRLGVAVGRKAGKAVVRNRWKRLLRETFRLFLKHLPEPADLVLVVKADRARRLQRRGLGGERERGGTPKDPSVRSSDRGRGLSLRTKRLPTLASVRGEILGAIRRAGL